MQFAKWLVQTFAKAEQKKQTTSTIAISGQDCTQKSFKKLSVILDFKN
jgi:hypothetical protein